MQMWPWYVKDDFNLNSIWHTWSLKQEQPTEKSRPSLFLPSWHTHVLGHDHRFPWLWSLRSLYLLSLFSLALDSASSMDSALASSATLPLCFFSEFLLKLQLSGAYPQIYSLSLLPNKPILSYQLHTL